MSNVTCLTLDVTSTPSVTAAARAVEASGRGLDVLVNNAGLGYVMPILDMKISNMRRNYTIPICGGACAPCRP